MARLFWVLALFSVLLVTTPSSAEEKRIDNFTMMAGTWSSWIGNDSVMLYIKEDGSYQSSGRAFRIDGQITLTDGKGRYVTSQGRTGTFTLHEEKGKTFLRSVRDDGSLTSDWDRIK